jgi:hypothetical protein
MGRMPTRRQHPANARIHVDRTRQLPVSHGENERCILPWWDGW